LSHTQIDKSSISIVYLFDRLSIGINQSESISKIGKGIREQAPRVCGYELAAVLSRPMIQFQLVEQWLISHHNELKP